MTSALQQAGQVANTIYQQGQVLAGQAYKKTMTFVASVQKDPTPAAVIGTAIIATAATVYFTDAHQPVINAAKYLLATEEPGFFASVNATASQYLGYASLGGL